MRNIQKAFKVLKRGAIRDLGFLVFFLVLGAFAAIVAFPLIWVIQFLPDWGWWVLGPAWFVWLIFGDSVHEAWTSYRGEHNE